MPMLYFTQIIFIKPGMEEQFLQFEAHVLPLLKKYNGTLDYRVRPSSNAVIETVIGEPYEIHICTFPTKDDFVAYSKDPERLNYLHLKEASIDKAILVEGKLL